MANYITIITPIDESSVARCRDYLRDYAEPDSGMQCKTRFRFDLLPNLHFASFVILEKTAGFAPSLVFEATFDGPKPDFISDLLRVAGDGLHELYQHCDGYPPSGLTTPELAKEYFTSHDVGANTYFSGSPGRTVAEIRSEGGIRSAIVNYFSGLQTSGTFAPRLDRLFAQLRGFIAADLGSRWVEQQAPVPWEVRYRRAIGVAAGIAALALACLIGAVCDWIAVKQGQQPLSQALAATFEYANQIGKLAAQQLAPVFRVQLPSELFPPVGLAVIWILLRVAELFLSNWSKHPRDQFFITRVPLHIVLILRHGVLAFFAGVVLLALVHGMGTLFAGSELSPWLVHLILFFTLFVMAIALVCLQYLATSLKIIVELRKLTGPRENLRRLALDLIRFAMLAVVAFGALIVCHHLPSPIAADTADWLIHRFLLLVAYGLVGALVLYAFGVLFLLAAYGHEQGDKKQFADPAALEARAAENAKKYAREEGGNNRFQNHLASLTYVKPGFFHGLALRATLFLINVLARFWFNVGTLGDIPTILSARWVLIDGGRRLLFLDNFGGAWNSYLNEFIDMAAVKGLNAIWTNTYVDVEGKGRFSFPETRFYFWQGAQAERPFKAYVRESQIETVVWYSAYPSLSVVNVNTSTAIRQALSQPQVPSAADAIIQNL